MKTFDQLSDDERVAIAKECEKRHFICVASEYHVDAHSRYVHHLVEVKGYE